MSGERNKPNEYQYRDPIPFPFGTPENRWYLVAFGIFVWFTTPVAAAFFFGLEFSRDAYPPDGDAIIIPIFGFFVMSVMLFPMYGAILWLAVARYSPEVSLLTWNFQRPIWSLFWTAVFLALILWCVDQASRFAWTGHVVPAGHELARIALLAFLRASVVMRQHEGRDDA